MVDIRLRLLVHVPGTLAVQEKVGLAPPLAGLVHSLAVRPHPVTAGRWHARLHTASNVSLTRRRLCTNRLRGSWRGGGAVAAWPHQTDRDLSPVRIAGTRVCVCTIVYTQLPFTHSFRRKETLI